MTMAFEYLEIRPCIEDKSGEVESFADEIEFEERRTLIAADERAFWSIYGRYTDEAGQFLAMAIGDFSTKADAFTVMNAILAPMAKARDLINEHGATLIPSKSTISAGYPDGGTPVPAYQIATDMLDDFIGQSSNHERL